ncbi:MAG: hypothetical protein WKF77_13485 [Planctomycetaceae bacterium]
MNTALRHLIIVATVVASLSVPLIADEDLEYSTVTGQVVYSGDRTKLAPLFLKGSGVKDAAICGAEDMPDERLIVDSKTQGVSNVFVWFDKIDQDSIHPDLTNEHLTPPQLVFEGYRIKPHSLCVQTRTGMRVTTSDPIAHNPRDYPLLNPAGCVALTVDLRGDNLDGFIHNFSVSEPGPMKITCDYHPWMSSYVLVQNHPYMAVTRAEGSFSIEKVPTGTQRLQIWHELGGRILREKVTLNSKLHDIGEVELKISPEVMSSLNFVKVGVSDPKTRASKE